MNTLLDITKKYGIIIARNEFVFIDELNSAFELGWAPVGSLAIYNGMYYQLVENQNYGSVTYKEKYWPNKDNYQECICPLKMRFCPKECRQREPEIASSKFGCYDI